MSFFEARLVRSREGARSGVADYADTLFACSPPAGPDPARLPHRQQSAPCRNLRPGTRKRPASSSCTMPSCTTSCWHAVTRRSTSTNSCFNYGEWTPRLAADLCEERAISGIDPRYFGFPMMRRIAERSRAVIVHNPGAAAIARDHGATNVFVIPHFFDPSPDRAEPHTSANNTASHRALRSSASSAICAKPNASCPRFAPSTAPRRQPLDRPPAGR